jgi:hypothetical protein
MLPRSVDVNFKSEFADSLHRTGFKEQLQAFSFVSEVKFPREVVARIQPAAESIISIGYPGNSIVGTILVNINRQHDTTGNV